MSSIDGVHFDFSLAEFDMKVFDWLADETLADFARQTLLTEWENKKEQSVNCSKYFPTLVVIGNLTSLPSKQEYFWCPRHLASLPCIPCCLLALVPPSPALALRCEGLATNSIEQSGIPSSAAKSAGFGGQFLTCPQSDRQSPASVMAPPVSHGVRRRRRGFNLSFRRL